MEIMELAKLGSQVVLDGIVLWLVVRYLPNRDKMFAEELRKHTAQLNRLVQAFVLSLDEDDRRRHKLSDDIFEDKEDS